MQEIAKSDLFFMITSVVVLFIGAIVIVIVAYVLKVVRDVSRITTVVRDEAEFIKEDLDDARRAFKLKGLGWLTVLKTVFLAIIKNRKKK